MNTTSKTGTDYWAFVNLLNSVGSVCLLVVGTFGNIFSIVILHRTKEGGSSQHVFLIALAVADLCFIYTTIFIEYGAVFGTPMQYPGRCQLQTFLPGVSAALSGWLVTAVTVQRTLAVKWPHKIRLLCSVKTAWAVVAALVIASCAMSFYLLNIASLRDRLWDMVTFVLFMC